MYGILLILTVILFSGLVAYLGDQIGMKVGKKRISLFTLRPKYTSIIITILTGILIATFSITILMVTNTSVRQAIFNINEVLVKLDSLNQQINLKDQELKEMKKEIDFKGEEVYQIQQLKNELELKLREAENEFAQAKEELVSAQTDIGDLEENRQELEDKVLALNTEREDLETKIAQLNHKIVRVNEEYEQLAAQYELAVLYYRGEDIIYQRGDIIYFAEIMGGQSQEKTIADLRLFLEKADKKVQAKEVRIDEKTNVALRLQDEAILNVASRIYNLEDEKIIVGLVAAVNVLRNDWVFADFILNKDHVIFTSGELIITKIIEAESSLEELELVIRDTLKKISREAVKRGLLPDNQGEVGSISFSQFYQLINQIKKYEGQLELKVYAQTDIWRKDRLSSNLKFEINPLGSGKENVFSN